MVEGYTDVISMHQAGVENVVSSSGTSLTVEQVQLLHRFTRNITIIYDGDPAGQKASLRGIDIILKEGMNVRVVLLPEPEDPDSFARSHTADEVQEYIRTHEEDFLSFKAKLLMKDAAGDPIRIGEGIADMVGSIALVEDAIQRSVFTKECARIMDADENVLISEVARRRVSKTADKESMEFVRRQQALIREEQSVEVNVQGSPVGGSGEDTLEKEIVKYLLKSGHKYFEQKEGKAYVPINVAEYIFNTLDRDKIELQDKALRELYKTYYELWQRSGVGEEIPQQHFVNHYLPEVCDVAVDLLTSDDNYVASDLWRRKEVHVESEVELLAAGVPKVIMIYQSKVIDRLIRAQHQRLQEELSDEEEAEVMKILNRLNKTKLTLAKLSRRLIL
jgi:DNA primase